MRRIAIINQKGGVGKTTTAANLGAALAAAGKTVLFVDLDPQTHLSLYLGVDANESRGSAYELLTEGRPLDDVALAVRPNGWLLPSNINLAAAEMELVSVVGREVILRDALEASRRDYDFVLIDCPPSLGILTLNALTAAEEVLIPLQPHFLALQGVGKLFDTVTLVRGRLNPRLRVSGILLCLHEAGTKLAAEVEDDLRRFLESARGTDAPWAEARVFSAVIRRNIKLAECPSHGKTIFDYEPRSNGALDYRKLAEEMLAEVGSRDADVGTESTKPAVAFAAEAQYPRLEGPTPSLTQTEPAIAQIA